MSASKAFQVALAKHLLQNEALANVGDAAGLPGSATAGSLYIRLHTADPGEGGNQNTSEATYTGYAPVPLARSAAGWSVDDTNGNYANASVVTFGKCTDAEGVTQTITHFSIGTTESGPGMILLSSALIASVPVTAPVTPSFAVGDLSGTVD